MERVQVIFGQKVREYRKENGMKLKDLAPIVDIPVPSLSMIERGALHLSLARAFRLAEATGINLYTVLSEYREEVRRDSILPLNGTGELPVGSL